MINRISSVQAQPNKAKPAFGTAYHFNLKTREWKTLSPETELNIISGVIKKAQSGELELEKVFGFSKFFRTKNGGRVESKIKTMCHLAYTDLFSKNGQQRIQIVKDKNMDEVTNQAYDTLAKILENIEPKK